jgi:7-carboxy-7-deazaguanine synthase
MELKGMDDLAESAIEYRLSKLSIPYLKGWVCLTGGEPLLQDLTKLVSLLKGRDYRIEIFTNGTIAPPEWFDRIDSWVVDAKCPSTGVCGVTKLGWWNDKLRPQDSLKFTVADEKDLDWVDFILGPAGRDEVGHFGCNVLVSPVIPENHNQGGDGICIATEWLQKVAKFCIKHDLRFSLQVHKVLYGNKRGV